MLTPALVVAKDKVISLKKNQTDIPLSGYFIQNIINVSGEKYYFGFRLNDANFQKEPVRFEKDITEEFKWYLDPLFFPDGMAITLRINKVFHYEVLLEESMLTMTDMNISFIEIRDSTFTELYRAAVSIHARKNIKRGVMLAINKCILNFNERNALGKLNKTAQPISGLNHNPLDEFTFDEFKKTDRTKHGIFRTYDDFFYNTPDTTIKFYIEHIYRIK